MTAVPAGMVLVPSGALAGAVFVLQQRADEHASSSTERHWLKQLKDALAAAQPEQGGGRKRRSCSLAQATRIIVMTEMKPVEAFAIIGPDGKYVAVDLSTAIGAWLAFKWPDDCQGTEDLIKLGYHCERVVVGPVNAAPQEPLATKPEKSETTPVNGTDKPGEKGLTPAGAAPRSREGEHKAWCKSLDLGGVSTCDCGVYVPDVKAALRSQPARELLREARLPGFIKPDTDTHVYFYEQDHYYLSNFSSFDLLWKGIRFATSEHAYHWERFTYTWHKNAIINAHSAHSAFRYAQDNKQHQRPDWDEIKVRVMRDILQAKAHQHEYVRRKLLQTGDKKLIEDSHRDPYWGWGPNADGMNILGKLWMEIRAHLKESGE